MNRAFSPSIYRRHSAGFARLARPKTYRSPIPAPVPVSPGSLFSPGFTRPRTLWYSEDENMPCGDHLIFTASGAWYQPEIQSPTPSFIHRW